MVEMLTPGKTGLRLSSEPSKAGIYINKKYAKMQTPSDIELEPGTYNIGLVRKNYATWNQDFILEADKITEKHIILELKVAKEGIPIAPKKPTLTTRVTELESVVSSMISSMEDMLKAIEDLKAEVAAAPAELVPVAVTPTEEKQVTGVSKLPTVCPTHKTPLQDLIPENPLEAQLYCSEGEGHVVYYGPRV